jgi:hypothetical protein
MEPSVNRKVGRRIVDVPSQGFSTRKKKPSRSTITQSTGPLLQTNGKPTPGSLHDIDLSRFDARAYSRETPERARWEELTEGVMSFHGRPYDPEATYTEGDVVLHKQYGLGVVDKVNVAAGTCSTVFRDGTQELAMGAAA